MRQRLVATLQDNSSTSMQADIGAEPARSHTSVVTESGMEAHASGIATRLPKIIPFTELCRCGDEVWIEHDGQLYRLRRTRLGKLILTK